MSKTMILYTSELMKGFGWDYEMTSILIHEGDFKRGHYFSLIKKEEKWWLCDDLRHIQPVNDQMLPHALTYGDPYFLKRCAPDSGSVHLKAWPPDSC